MMLRAPGPYVTFLLAFPLPLPALPCSLQLSYNNVPFGTFPVSSGSLSVTVPAGTLAVSNTVITYTELPTLPTVGASYTMRLLCRDAIGRRLRMKRVDGPASFGIQCCPRVICATSA